MVDVFSLADDLGPLKVIHVHIPKFGVDGILVIDNVAAGPSIGGLRMAPDVTLKECARLARAMTMKNAAAGLSHGGGKSVLIADPRVGRAEKEGLIRAFAAALKGEEHYIFGPDMGTDEECMAWIKDEIGRSVGLPHEIGGIPLDELGATGFGLAKAADVAIQYCDFSLDGARVAVQGFGSVGMHAMRFLAERGAVLVAAADSRGTIADPYGINLNQLMDHKAAGNPLSEFSQGEAMDRDAIVGIDCDIWIPAARPDVINEDNVKQMKTRLILEGANIPITPGAERKLEAEGVVIVPDFIANAGGVICAAMEYHGASETGAFQSIKEKLTANTAEVLERAKREGISAREAAVAMAEERVRAAMTERRFGIF